MTDVGKPQQIAYSSSTGQYRDLSTGRFVRRTEVMKFVDREIERTKVQLQGHTRLLIGDRINMAEWQVRMAETLKASHIRMGALGSGGVENLNSRKYGAIGYQLRQQYEYLSKFSLDVAEGWLTPKQALVRSGLYATSIKLSFNRCEQLTKQEEGFRTARRGLDPQANHCASCINYSTRGQWMPIDQVVLPGVACECGQFCKCPIEFSKFGVEAFSRAVA